MSCCNLFPFFGVNGLIWFNVLFVFCILLYILVASPVSNGQANREPARQSQVGGKP